MEPTLLSALAQFGAAGLIGWMWLSERRAAAMRERQLTDLQDRILQERPQITTLISVVQDNTRALTALESGQRGLTVLIERLSAK
jgi:hypothetical protein